MERPLTLIWYSGKTATGKTLVHRVPQVLQRLDGVFWPRSFGWEDPISDCGSTGNDFRGRTGLSWSRWPGHSATHPCFLMVITDFLRANNFPKVSRPGFCLLPLPLPGPGVWMKVVSMVKLSSGENSWLEFNFWARDWRYVFSRSLSSRD